METGEFRIDLHVQSSGSPDSSAEPAACIERAIERGLHGIAFTEHYYYGASEPVERLRERYRGRILIVRGVEFSAAEGHCLVFGVDTDRLLTPYAPFADLLREVLRAGGVAIPAHPYRSGGSGLGELAFSPGIVAIEGHNGYTLRQQNERAIAAARQRGLAFTGGSDAHAAEEVGACYTVFRERVTGENLVTLLKEGRFEGVDTRKVSQGWFGW